MDTIYYSYSQITNPSNNGIYLYKHMVYQKVVPSFIYFFICFSIIQIFFYFYEVKNYKIMNIYYFKIDYKSYNFY